MHRLLVLSQFYYPENHDKATQVARSFVDQGYDVTALTTFPNYPLGKIYEGYKQRLWVRQELFGAKVVRLPIYASHSRSLLSRAAHFASFSAMATLLGPSLTPPADLMWVYHPPPTIGIPAWWLSRLKRIPFIYDVQDMWPETAIDAGMVRQESAIVRGLERVLNFTYQNAEAICVCSPGFKRNLIAKGVPADKIHLIHYWINDDMFIPQRRDDNLGRELELANRFNIMFTGNMGPAQGLETVIAAAKLVQDLRDVQFVFVGDGLCRADLQRRAEEAKLSNVRFIPHQPIERISQILAWSDSLILHLIKQPLYDITIPSKLYHYMASARPVICAASGDTADIVRESNCGIICEPHDPRAIAAAVRKLYQMPVESRIAMGDASRTAFEHRFSRSVLLKKYKDLFEEVIGKKQKRALTPA